MMSGCNADGTGIHSWQKNEFQQVINIFCQAFQETGLKINLFKTETMIWNWNEITNLYAIIKTQYVTLVKLKHLKQRLVITNLV